MYAHVVKQAEVQEVQVGENMFYLRPFPAFKAVRMTGELSTIAGPVLASIAALSTTQIQRMRSPRSCRRSSLSRATSWNG